MPTAGDEGYEKLVICPYDKSHEIRKGRMQFHLDKCRKNFPDSEMIRCPFNSTHLIAKCEKEFHTREECVSRCNFDRNYIQYGDESPVANLVSVHAGTIPDGDENWEDVWEEEMIKKMKENAEQEKKIAIEKGNFLNGVPFITVIGDGGWAKRSYGHGMNSSSGVEVQPTVSVLNTIQTEAANKKIMRMMQCESKAKRKNFRKEEKKRHEELSDISVPPMEEGAASLMYQNQAPLPRPKNPTKIQVEEQDPAEVRAILQLAKLNVGVTPAGAAALPSETPSLPDESSSANSRFEDAESGAMSYKAMLSQKKTPSGAAPTPSVSLGNRPSTAKSIAVSVGQAKNPKVQDNPALKSDGFLMIAIPGSSQGRGKFRIDQ